MDILTTLTGLGDVRASRIRNVQGKELRLRAYPVFVSHVRNGNVLL